MNETDTDKNKTPMTDTAIDQLFARSAAVSSSTGDEDAFLARLKAVPYQNRQADPAGFAPFQDVRALWAQAIGLVAALAAGLAFGMAGAVADDSGALDLSDGLFDGDMVEYFDEPVEGDQ